MANEFLDQNGLKQVLIGVKEIIDTKVPNEHKHEIDDINGLENSLNSKSPIGHTHDEYLSNDTLGSAVNDALEQAKASGEFKGDKGDQGEQGIQGIQGEKGDKGDKGDTFRVEDLTDADKQELRQGLVAYQKKVTYSVPLASGTKSFAIPDQDFRYGVDIVILHLNGIYFHENVDYTVSGNAITLTNSVANASTAEVEIIRAVIADSGSYALLKGDKGDQGEQGIQGIQGIQGEKGDKGDNGEPISTANFPLTGNSGTVYICANVGKITNGNGFSVIIQSRAGETVWVNCTANDASYKGYAIRMSNTHGKTAGIWYDQTTGYLYTQQNAWSNLVSFTVIATTFSIRQPSVSQVSSVPSTAKQIDISDIALKSDLGDVTSGKLTTNWSASQDSSGNLVFTYA